MKNKALEAYRLLNDFVGDLVAGTRTLELYQSPKIKAVANHNTQLFVRRMCLSYLIITMSKWSEFYKKYKSIIPTDVVNMAKNLQKAIDSRELVTFRNTAVGHIWDNKLKRALTSQEIDIRLQKVFSNNENDFLKWINDHENNNQKETVINILELIRKRIQEEYKLTENEIFQ